MSGVLRSIATSVAFYVMFPWCGLVMMAIECNWSMLQAADWGLAFILPLYGHVIFWTC